MQRIIELPLDQVFVSLTVKLERREAAPFPGGLPAEPHGSDADVFNEPRMAGVSLVCCCDTEEPRG